VGLDFPRFHLVVISNQSGQTTRAIRYRDSLSVAWLLIWRTAVIAASVQGLLFAAIWMMRGSRPVFPDRTYLTLPGFLALLQNEVLSLLIFFISVNKAAIRKTYRHFSLRVEPAEVRA
jgi:hypothetical protein